MDYTIRKLNSNDYESFLQLINDFRETNFSQTEFIEILNKININSDIWVIEHNSKLVTTGTVIYETKFIHNLGICAHIEDICVKESYRKQGLGKIMMNHLITEAKTKNSYKIILDCSHGLESYYSKFGFYNHGIQMSQYT